ncbi:MAG: hypothetical protein Q9204_007552 [Flavoplaca sp. TL-2023a]
MAVGLLGIVRQRPSNLLPRPPGPIATNSSVSAHGEHLDYLQSLAKKIRLAAIPWPGRYMFPTTCSYRSARYIIIKEPKPIFNGIYDLPQALRDEGSECRLHKPYLQWIEHDTLSITPEEKGVLMTNHSELCSVLEGTSNDLRHYYQHIDWFRVLLHRSTTANAGTERRPTTATGPPSRLQIQKMNSKRVSEFISQWQKDYDGLVTLGVEFAGDIDHFRHRLLTLRTRLSDLQGHVAGARQDVVNKWPVLRRLCRDVGLIRYEAEETRDYSDALEVLNPWLTATIKREKLLALVSTNVTATHQDLDGQLAARFSADALYLFGPAASPSLPSWWREIREKART